MKVYLQSLTFKMILLISVLILFVCMIYIYLLQIHIRETTEEQRGEEALSVAKMVASMEEIVAAFEEEQPSIHIQPLAEKLRSEIDAAFIVVGNAEGIRYSHPVAEQIGERMVGGDNDAALLDKRFYVSKTVGGLGESIRGKAPIMKEGEIIGVVSVGFLTNFIDEKIDGYLKKWLSYTCLILAIGIIGAIAISYYIKRLLFNMEPQQIAKLYSQHQLILATTEEGIIATDRYNNITTINNSAYQIIDASQKKALAQWQSENIEHIFTLRVAQQKNIHNLELVLGEEIIILNKVPLADKMGSLYTFRRKTNIQNVVNELKEVRQYANAQRAQTHEFANKLHIIFGLLLHKRYDEAIEFIREERQIQMDSQSFLNSQMASPLLLALIQGKITEAAELGIQLELPNTDIDIGLSTRQERALLTALGNVLQNAIDVLKNSASIKKVIQLSIMHYKTHYTFEIQDSGPGIVDAMYEQIFMRGISTKEGFDRGHGLAISMQALKDIGGEISIDEGDLSGACFIITIPIEEEQ
ncbi:ATP-binding protein [Metasolibacillus meyeri]|uniref:ATP-binding protein n=1 Tax=Metasolibacillus meyeri TaxID=1071052 RepID=UPI000D3276EC|nr:sensor histidine kinase [Metasolibacillus meyeri]